MKPLLKNEIPQLSPNKYSSFVSQESNPYMEKLDANLFRANFNSNFQDGANFFGKWTRWYAVKYSFAVRLGKG